MNDMEEIKGAIERLTSAERAHIASWLRHAWGITADMVAEAAAAPYVAAPEPQRMSVEEYLEFEKTSSIRHEYVAGTIFAMSGATLRHVAITRNLVSAFAHHLRGKPCQAFMNDVKVRIKLNRDEIFYYPDVVVACGKLDMESHYLREPKLIVEVLSPSTQATDRREKALHYRQIDSLEEYVLVAQHKHEVIISRRSERWQLQVLRSADAVAEFRSIGRSLPVRKIYEGVF